VVVCDYGRGITAHDELRRALTDAARRRPLVWDPHPKGAVPVPGTALAVPNADEALVLSGAAEPRDLAGDTARAVRLLAEWPVTPGRHHAGPRWRGPGRRLRRPPSGRPCPADRRGHLRGR
jgi:hypothetical protein